MCSASPFPEDDQAPPAQEVPQLLLHPASIRARQEGPAAREVAAGADLVVPEDA